MREAFKNSTNCNRTTTAHKSALPERRPRGVQVDPERERDTSYSGDADKLIRLKLHPEPESE